MKGTGRIVRGLSGESEAHYSIGVWRTSEGPTFGHGEIAGTSEELVGLPRWPLPLILADGRRIDVTVVKERTGRNAVEVYVAHTDALTSHCRRSLALLISAALVRTELAGPPKPVPRQPRP